MRRRPLLVSLLSVAAVGAMGASTCTTTGPSARRFEAGALVVPMDNCYQKRDGTSASGGQSLACNATADDGVFRAYGLVYFLLKHGITVYWGIDGAHPKLDVVGPDIVVPAPPAGLAVAQRYNWASNTFADLATGSSGITYLGGPFVIDAAQAATALDLFASHPDFARLKAEAAIDIHKVQVAFDAPQVRPLTQSPPRLAILNINPAPIHKTSVDVMYRYAVAAGLSWPCTGNGDCAGGIGPGCNLQAIYDYLSNRGSSFVSPVITTPPATNPQAVFNRGPGLAYDILCDGDFIPPPGGTYGDTQLAKGGYKLLWAPHWDTAGVDPLANPPTTASTALAAQLKTIADYVDAGNNLFAECLAIGALETGRGMKGMSATRFQTTAGMLDTTGSGNGTLQLQGFAPAQEPNIQVGDFVLSGADVDGAITTFHPDNAPSSPGSLYRPGVQRLIFGTAGNKSGSSCSPACTSGKVCWNNTCVESGPWDVATTFVVPSPDGVGRGSVAYLGGHDYSPSAEPNAKTPSAHAQAGQTAGTRIVLNTLFNLGFACADPNTTCTTGLLGACAQGVLKCAGGGLQCVAPSPGAPDCTTPDADADCNGVADRLEAACQQPACAEGATRNCYGGPTGTDGVGACRHGTQTCSGGLWGACQGEVVPQAEACNRRDDDCDGNVDDGDLCGPNAACTNGICLPSACSAEGMRCPAGFACSRLVSGICEPLPCPTTACPAGQLCRNDTCVDPCAGVSCGQGSTCSGGTCVAGGCTGKGCSDPSQVCVAGTCVADACAGNTCPQGTFCRLGDCVRSCAYVSCAAGQHCDADGFCQPDCSPACGAGQACVAGACVADACAGVTCAAGQECRAGACLDLACAHVKCPLVGQRCEAGQCLGGVSSSVDTPITPVKGGSSSGGCGTGGAGDLASLALAAGAMWARRRRLAAILAPRRATVAAAGAALLVVGGACAKASPGGGAPVCASGQSACGADCVDLAASLLHCGACGHGCAQGFSCTAGACVFPTGNPLVQTVTPAAFALGAAPELRLTGLGFQAGATVRVTGLGRVQELPLQVASPTAATLPAAALDLSGAAVGTGELRVLNPGRLVSNALPLTLVDALGVRSLEPGIVRQDQAGTVALRVLGIGFVSGATVSLVVNGASQALDTTFVGPGELGATLPVASALPVGRHGVVVTNPGGASAAPATLAISEGVPVIATIDPLCSPAVATFAGSVTGTYLYPTSVVRVSGAGGSIVDSPLATSCVDGTDALGQCKNGRLRVTADLSPVTPGPYRVSVWNPGTPNPLRSTGTFVMQVNGAGSACP